MGIEIHSSSVTGKIFFQQLCIKNFIQTRTARLFIREKFCFLVMLNIKFFVIPIL